MCVCVWWNRRPTLQDVKKEAVDGTGEKTIKALTRTKPRSIKRWTSWRYLQVGFPGREQKVEFWNELKAIVMENQKSRYDVESQTYAAIEREWIKYEEAAIVCKWLPRSLVEFIAVLVCTNNPQSACVSNTKYYKCEKKMKKKKAANFLRTLWSHATYAVVFDTCVRYVALRIAIPQICTKV